MQACLHDQLQEGSTENSDEICGFEVCCLCIRLAKPTKLSCMQCGKNICTGCYLETLDSSFAMYLAITRKRRGLYKIYRETPRSASTLIPDDYYKTEVFRMHGEMEVERAEERLRRARLELERINHSIQSAKANSKPAAPGNQQT